MRIPKHIKKYIEGELISYPYNKKALAYVKQNLYLKNSTNGYITRTRDKYFTSNVEQKVPYLMSDRNIIRLEYLTSAIEDILEELPEEYRQLIELRYFKSYKPDWIANELSICVRNFFNWRDKAIELFAIRLGLI